MKKICNNLIWSKEIKVNNHLNLKKCSLKITWDLEWVCLVKVMVFPVVMYRCENWTVKKAEPWRIDAFELWCWRRLLSPLDCKEIQPVPPKGDQSWVFIGRNDAKAETPVLWLPHEKSWPTGKDSDAGRDWGQEEKGMTEDEMAGWHHQLDGCEFEWTSGVGDGQGSLACCDSWGRKESDTTEQLNWTERVGERERLCACFVIFFCLFRIRSSQILLFTSPLSQNLLKVGTLSQTLHSSPN